MTTPTKDKFKQFHHALLQSPEYLGIASKTRPACVQFVSIAAMLTSKKPPDPDKLEAAYGPALAEAKRLVAEGLLTVELPSEDGEPESNNTEEEAVPAPVAAEEVSVSEDDGEQPSMQSQDEEEPQSAVPISPDKKSTTDDPLAKFNVHPAAAIFPIMSGKPMDEFTADIKLNGLRDPIVMSNGQVVDGRNRLIGCLRAGIEPTFIEWTGGGSIVDWIVSVNLYRRHLNDSQRAMASAKVAEVLAVEGKHRSARNLRNSGDLVEILDPGSRDKGSSAEKAATLLNVSTDAVTKAAKVIRKGTEKLAEAVMTGDVSLDAAAMVANLPRKKQEEVIKKGKVKETAKNIRKEKAASKAKAKKVDDADKAQVPVPVTTEEVIPAQVPIEPLDKPETASEPVDGAKPASVPRSIGDDLPVLQELHDALDTMVIAAAAVGKMARVTRILSKMLETVNLYTVEFDNQ